MSDQLIGLSGELILPENLKVPRAAAFARYVLAEANQRFTLRECRQKGDSEGVAVTVWPEVPQRPCHDIRYEEPLLVSFDGRELGVPEVQSLRKDFPDVPHLNLRRELTPKSLCLFAEPPEDLNLRWTPALLGERILWWLQETAQGTLHRGDQGLEPFIGGVPRPLILPPDIFSEGDTEILSVYRTVAGPSGEVLLADHAGAVPPGLADTTFTLLPLVLPPQEHGVIRMEPSTLKGLHELCQQAGVDLLGMLRRKLQEKITAIRSDSSGTILLLFVPKLREADGEVESADRYGFRCRVPGPGSQLLDIGPGKLGETLNWLGADGQRYFPLVGASTETVAGAGIAVSMLAPQFIRTPAQAAALSGLPEREDLKVFTVGMGALGSQVFTTLARQGWGQWQVLDEDYLAPHNVVRHAVLGRRFGIPKALEMAGHVSEMFAGPPIAEGMPVNVLSPGDKEREVAKRAREASLILDMSASVAVSRHLTLSLDAPAQRAAAFLSPSGLDLVVMAEGKERAVPMDAVELQYLRSVLNDPRLLGHLSDGDGVVRYGGSCRDVSARISQERVGLHAAIAARIIRRVAGQEEPLLGIWRCEPEWMGVEHINVPLSQELPCPTQSWTVVTDEGLRSKLLSYRSGQLPRETCGILLGYYDTQRRRIYLADVLPAPADSVEEDNSCERGISGLNEAVMAASRMTLGQLGYIGEWHSHPDGISVLPSSRDIQQLSWIAARLHPEGKPALIVIACEGNVLSVLVQDPQEELVADCEIRQIPALERVKPLGNDRR